MTVARIAIALSLAVAAAIPGPAAAQVQYGSWSRTSDCRPAKMPVGPGRGMVPLPSAGGSGATECKWVRDVQDCPRIRDNLRHPIQCATRKQTSGYSIGAPSN